MGAAEFAPLDLLLMMVGCKICVPNRCIRVINILFLLIIMASYAATIILSQILEGTMYKILTILMFYGDCFFGMIFIAVMIMNRKKFLSVLSVIDSMTESQKQRLKRHSFVSVSIIVILTAIDVVKCVLHLQHANTNHIIVDSVRFIIENINCWVMSGCMVYSFFVKVILMREESYFKTLLITLSTSGKAMNERNLVIERRKVTEFKESITDSFSLIPCLWFTFTFLEVAMVFQDITETSVTLAGIRLFEMSCRFLALAYVVNVCEKTTAYTKNMTNAVTSLLIDCGRKAELIHLFDQLKESSDFSFTVCSMFDMNRRFALSFLASLITFTVLFIQIASAMAKPKSSSESD